MQGLHKLVVLIDLLSHELLLYDGCILDNLKSLEQVVDNWVFTSALKGLDNYLDSLSDWQAASLKLIDVNRLITVRPDPPLVLYFLLVNVVDKLSRHELAFRLEFQNVGVLGL